MSTYYHHYACFKCSKSFKRKYDVSLTLDEQVKKTCPDCRGLAVNCGRHFKAPKKSERKQWEKVKLLFENGFRFQHIYDGDKNLIPYPKTLDEAKKFIIEHRHSKYRIRS